jgi:hypothetical protein
VNKTPALSARGMLLWASLSIGAACGSDSDPGASSGGVAGQPSIIVLRPYDQAPIPCGSTACVQNGQPNFSIPRVCCVDSARSLCGTRSSNNDCIGALDMAAASSCPKSTIFGMELNGCCTAKGQCGADSTAVGLGCVDLADMNFRNLAENPPEPRPCNQVGSP